MLSANEAYKLLMDASCIVGMHPDQALGAIVDFALKFNKAFAVVPCCVFSKEFPKRRLKNGQPVKNYDDLVQWVMEKDDSIEKVILGFEGRNVCLVYHPKGLKNTNSSLSSNNKKTNTCS
mmetsp:Transcript_467/g.633  ORF Transcript_467/g.633 Transcript_467/m.633 type:complete len:120 (-) Transcript_467:43-402(-)